MSSRSRQSFLMHYVQCRVTLDSAFWCTRSNVESPSTALSIVPGQMSSHTRQRFPLFQVQCRVTLDRTFRCSKSNVESRCRAFSAVQGPMSSSNRRVLLQCLILVFTKLVLYNCSPLNMNLRDFIENLFGADC
jgi:hypothetical protein